MKTNIAVKVEIVVNKGKLCGLDCNYRNAHCGAFTTHYTYCNLFQKVLEATPDLRAKRCNDCLKATEIYDKNNLPQLR